MTDKLMEDKLEFILELFLINRWSSDWSTRTDHKPPERVFISILLMNTLIQQIINLSDYFLK